MVNGNVLSRNDDIANEFNDHFPNAANVLIKDDFIACSTSNVPRDDCSNVTQPKLNLPCISHDFDNDEILRMSTMIATGLDDIIAAKFLSLPDLLLWIVLLLL